PVQVAVPREGALAPGQTERWLAASYDPAAASALNESFCLTLEGAVDLEALRTATLDVMERHDAFRIGFSLEEPLQRVARQDSLRLENLDLRSERNPDAALAEFCRRASRRAFDIQHPPLMAVTMLRLAPQRTVVHVVASHLVFDGWAASVFVSELATAYTARAAGKEPVFATAESPLQFAAALNERFQSDAGKA